MAQLLTSIKTEARPPTTAVSRLPSLDGWRAVSILLVLGCHSTYAGGFPAALTPAFNAIFDGNLGVRFFFIISGFLITWLMILENEKNGSVSLREFYIRRCLRILPIYVVFLGVLAVLELAGIGRESTAAWVGNLTFTRNFLGGFLGGDSFSAHLWSLSVEEQFYLIWPILYLLLRKQGERSLLGLLAIPILAAPAIRGIGTKWFYPGIFYSQMLKPVFWGDSFFKYFDTLAFGCACAVLLTHRRVMIERGLKNRPGVTVATGIALILFPHYSSWLHLEAVAVAQAGQTMQALGFSILLLHSVDAGVVWLSRIELGMGSADWNLVVFALYLAATILAGAAMLWLKSRLVDGRLDDSFICGDHGVLLWVGTAPFQTPKPLS